MHEADSVRVCFNGAATLSLRKSIWIQAAPAAISLLQWGRNFIVAEIGNGVGWSLEEKSALQWGRNFIVAEILSCGLRPLKVLWASMGPQLYRCGNAGIVTSVPSSTRCFNGAATLSLRKLSNRAFLLSNSSNASMGPQLYRCGNLLGWSCHCLSCQASMGPQLYRCGNDCRHRDADGGITRFNGAATLSLRKWDAVWEYGDMFCGLQWGRNFIVAEMLITTKDATKNGDELQWGRNFIVAEIMYSGNWFYIGSSLQWGRNFIVAEICHADPSLKPIITLQWGRNFIVAEMVLATRSTFNTNTLQWGRNFIVAEMHASRTW